MSFPEIFETQKSSIFMFLSQKNRWKNCRTATEVSYEMKKDFNRTASSKLRQIGVLHEEINDLQNNNSRQNSWNSLNFQNFLAKKNHRECRTRTNFGVLEQTFFVKLVQNSSELEPHMKQSIYKMTNIVSKLTKWARFSSFFQRKNNEKISDHN